MLEFEQLGLKLTANEPELRDLKDALGYNALCREIEELETKAAAPGFWDDLENSQKVLQKTGKLKNTVAKYDGLCQSHDDLMVLIELGNEEGDISLIEEIESGISDFEKGLAELRLTTLLTGEYDKNNAVITFHAGAGGTEAMDWVSMLVRMYTRWTERHGFKVSLLDFLDGDEAGLKSAVLNYLNHAQMRGEKVNPDDLAASFQKAVVDVLTEHAVMAIKQFKLNDFALAGGVASNSALRASMAEACDRLGVRFYCPSPVYCTDNAAMIGVAAYDEYIKGNFADYSLNAIPNIGIEEG